MMMSLPTPLLDAVADFSAHVSSDAVIAIAVQLRQLRGTEKVEAALLQMQRRLHPTARTKFQLVIEEWRCGTQIVPAAELAAAIEGALHQATKLRGESSVELVWSGPATPWSGFRSTEQVLLEVIGGARRSLFIVTFAAYKVGALVQAIEAAVKRGVKVSFLLEDKEESDGKVKFDAALGLTLSRLEHVTTYVWPLSRRPRSSQGLHGSLHAKFVVADDDVLFVSSANLTDYAMNLNVELGTLMRGGDAPKQVTLSLAALVRDGVFRAADL
ncbi:DISARM system phospholipase D-like protein DrmC [Paraburkholderia nodosa]|uniref:DISARM system phospholipase D-like protein DrmC n=1 Tax=Paraburkholderia nodosa TaxID=392320 RepID=UPI000489D2AB|nr:DISARM system phospholipase D-like protein DrmC [Paraburkholderia nodosa]